MPAQQNPTRVRALDAAFDLVAEVGLVGLTLEGLASRAGVSRQTIYRHFGSREGLVEALVLREEHVFIDRVVAAAAEHDDPEAAIAAGVTAAVDTASEHPLLQRILATEPEAILPLLVMGKGPVISVARPVAEQLIRERLDASEQDVEAAGDVCTRLLVSYILDPGPEPSEAVGRRIARTILRGLFTSEPVSER